MKLTIARQLGAMLAVAILGLAVVGGLSLHAFSRLQDAGESLFGGAFEPLAESAQLAMTFQQQRTIVQRAPTRSDPDELQSDRQEFEQLGEDLRARLDALMPGAAATGRPGAAPTTSMRCCANWCSPLPLMRRKR